MTIQDRRSKAIIAFGKINTTNYVNPIEKINDYEDLEEEFEDLEMPDYAESCRTKAEECKNEILSQNE